jgi:hypothetical protein
MTFDRAEWNDRGCDTALDDAAQLEAREVLELTHADTRSPHWAERGVDGVLQRRALPVYA